MNHSTRHCLRSVALVLCVTTTVSAQETRPRAMTADEIRAELSHDPPLRGQIRHAGRTWCYFNSDSAAGSPLSMIRPAMLQRVTTERRPDMAVILPRNANAERLRLFRVDGSLPAVTMTLAPAPGASSRFRITFSGSLPFGDYQFAVTQGTLILYLPCAFSVAPVPERPN